MRAVAPSWRLTRPTGVPLLRCAEIIGVSYDTVVYKAREQGVAQRMNRGRVTGERIMTEKRKNGKTA